MPVYFDPNQMFNAFAQGSQVGGGIRKSQAQSKLSPMIAAGDYKGANAFAASRGDLEMMDYLRPMAKEAEDADFNKRFGGMLATGDTKGAAAMGFADGRIEQGMAAGEYGRTIRADQITDYQSGVAFLAQEAGSLKSVAPELRGAKALEVIAQTPWAQDQTVMAGIQRLAADGVISDQEIDEFVKKILTPQEQYQREQDAKLFDYGAGQDELAQSNWERQFAAARTTAVKREIRNDAKGVPRYVDNGEPVYPDVTAAAKPLIGTETMARVATGLPNAKRAVAELETLLFNSKGTGLSMEGYSPLRDVGAGIVQDLGHIPVIGGAIRGGTNSAARMLGGEDYQMFEDSYDTFEAAMLPIMSGAAIPESEAKRQMQAVKIVPFDSEATKKRKIAAQKEMISGLELATRGDVEGFLTSLDRAGKSVAEVEAEEIDALVQQYGVR